MKFAGHLVMVVLVRGCGKNLLSEQYFSQIKIDIARILLDFVRLCSEAHVWTNCRDLPFGVPYPVQDASLTLHDSQMDMEIGILHTEEQYSDVIDNASGKAIGDNSLICITMQTFHCQTIR